MQDIDALWDFQKPQESEQRFRSALLEHPEDGELQTQLARSLGLQKRFDEAHTELDKVEKNLPLGASRLRVRYLLERGRALNSSGEPGRALPLFQEASEVASQAGEAGLEIDALHMVAIADPERSLETNLAAIAKAEASDDERARKWLASLYNNTGWSYFSGGDPASALSYFQKAVPLREAMGNEANLTAAKWCVARALRELGQSADALSILNAIEPSAPDDPFVCQEIAFCREDLGSVEEARPMATKALELFETPDWQGACLPENKARLEKIVR
jgi:tetratricopeptide (TPR) repeat protein